MNMKMNMKVNKTNKNEEIGKKIRTFYFDFKILTFELFSKPSPPLPRL